MKNHIKNYIKIMGLAAVPFGTAQAVDCKVKVTQEYTCDPNDPKSEKDGAMHFKISVSVDGGESRAAEIVWRVDKEYPNPIFRSEGFLRIYGAELRKEITVIDTTLGQNYNREMNAKEWAEFYMPSASKKEKMMGWMRAFGWSVNYAKSIAERIFGCEKDDNSWYYTKVRKYIGSKKEFFVKASESRYCLKNPLEHGRHDSWGAWLDCNKDSIFLCPPYDFPEDCICVGYLVETDRGSFRLYLLRDPHGFRLVVIPGYGKVCNLRVLSDVPTVCLGCFNRLYTGNEILNQSVRKRITDNFFVGHHKYSVQAAGRSLPSGFCAGFFIREGHRPDEIELNGENAAPERCDYFVQLDPFGERITDIWEKGKRLNTDDTENREFKDPKEIVKFPEEKFGRKEDEKSK